MAELEAVLETVFEAEAETEAEAAAVPASVVSAFVPVPAFATPVVSVPAVPDGRYRCRA